MIQIGPPPFQPPMSRRGSSDGPTLIPRLASVGLRVRMTSGSGFMAGTSGTIMTVGGQDVEVLFDGGIKRSIPMRKLQVRGTLLTPEQRDALNVALGHIKQEEFLTPEEKKERESFRDEIAKRAAAKWNF